MANAEGLPPSESIPERLDQLGDDKELAELWKKRITDGERYRNQKKATDNWKRWRDKAAGRWTRLNNRGDAVFVNKPYAVINSVVNRTYSRNPEYVVLPRRPGIETEAENQTHLMNYYVEEIGLKREAKLATKEAFIIGHGWLKVFWKSDVQRTPIGIPLDFGRPVVRRVAADDVLFDPEAKRIEDARWIAHRTVRPTKSVQDDPKYKNTEKLKPSHSSSMTEDDRLMLRTDDLGDQIADSDRTILWEVEDLEHKMLVTIAEGHDLVLRSERDSYEILEDTGMWVQVEADEDLDSPNGIGILSIIEALCDEKNTLRTRNLNHTKRALPKILYTEAVDREALEDLTRGDDLALAKVPTLDSVKALDMPNLPIDNARAEAQVDHDIAETAGSGELQRGSSPAGAQTATEIAVIGQNERIASSARVDLVEDAMKKVGRKLLKLMRTYMKTPQVVRILGKDGSVTFREFTPSEIKGEFDVSVQLASTVRRDELERRMIDQNLYNLVKDDLIVRRIEVLKDIFKDSGKRDMERYLMLPAINFEAYANALVSAVQTSNVQLAIATLQAVIQNLNPPAAGPATPIAGIPSARPIGQSLAAGPPRGSEGPIGPIPNLGQLRAAALGPLTGGPAAT